MSFIGACLGGLIARLIFHPFDTGRVNLQLKFTGIKSSILVTRELLNKNGILYLYNGLGLSSIGSILGTGVYISSYNTLYNTYGDKTSVSAMGSAFIAESLASLIFVPVAIATERVQVKSELSEYRVKNSFTILIKMIKTGGFRTLFKGYWSTLGVFVPLSVVQMSVYESIKNKLKNCFDKDGIKCKLIAATASGGLAWWITSPLDIIRFRLQVQNDQTKFSYRGLLHGVACIYRDKGLLGLFRGSVNRSIFGAITFTTIIGVSHLRLMKQLLKLPNAQHDKLEYEFKCRLSVEISKIFEDKWERFPRLIKNTHYTIASIIALSSGIILISPPTLFHNALIRHQIKLSALSLAYISSNPLAFDLFDSKTSRYSFTRIFISLKTLTSSFLCLTLADYNVFSCMLLLSFSSLSYSMSCKYLARKALIPDTFAIYQSRLSLFIAVTLLIVYIKAYFVAKDLKSPWADPSEQFV